MAPRKYARLFVFPPFRFEAVPGNPWREFFSHIAHTFLGGGGGVNVPLPYMSDIIYRFMPDDIIMYQVLYTIYYYKTKYAVSGREMP